MRALSRSGTSTVTEGPRRPGEGLFATRQNRDPPSSGESLAWWPGDSQTTQERASVRFALPSWARSPIGISRVTSSSLLAPALAAATYNPRRRARAEESLFRSLRALRSSAQSIRWLPRSRRAAASQRRTASEIFARERSGAVAGVLGRTRTATATLAPTHTKSSKVNKRDPLSRRRAVRLLREKRGRTLRPRDDPFGRSVRGRREHILPEET